jgi:hypothetical protein
VYGRLKVTILATVVRARDDNGPVTAVAEGRRSFLPPTTIVIHLAMHCLAKHLVFVDFRYDFRQLAFIMISYLAMRYASSHSVFNVLNAMSGMGASNHDAHPMGLLSEPAEDLIGYVNQIIH